MMLGTRINKFLSKFGSFSRRQADQLINQGRVTINNKNAELGYLVKENDIVMSLGPAGTGKTFISL